VAKLPRNQAGDLEWWLANSNPAEFGGVVLDEATGTVRVYARGGSSRAPLLLSELQALAAWEASAVVDEFGKPVANSSPMVNVDIVPAVKTFAQLSELAVGISGVSLDGKLRGDKNSKWANQVGGRLVSVQPDYSLGQIEVGVADASDADTLVAASQFPGDVRVVKKERGQKLARMSDNAPHFGGSNISGPLGNDCSTAFTVATSGGVRKMLTAGHCGAVGDTWVSSVNSYSFGSLQGSLNCYACRDDAYFGGSTYNAYAYTGSSAYYNGAWNPPNWDNSGSYAAVKGMSTSSSGVNLIASGSRTGQSGGHQVPVNNALLCVAIVSDYNCGMRYTTRAGGSYVQVGDSGGAVYVYESNQLKAVGIISGTSTYNLYYTPISGALGDFGLSLVTA
jgi:hypothetical protein